MSSLLNEIMEEFYCALIALDNFDEEDVEQLRVLFSGRKRPKAGDVIRVFSENTKERRP